MSEAVLVVGPATVCGPDVVDAAMVAVALQCVDDRLAVYADHVVTVRELWCDLVREVCAGDRDSAVLVVPSWWRRSRVEFVEDVLLTVCRSVIVLRRGTAWPIDASAVVEIGPDCVVVHAPGGERSVVSRSEATARDADAVLAMLEGVASALIDVPCVVSGATALADELARRLRRRNVEVSIMDDDAVCRAVEAARFELPAVPPPRRVRIGAPRVAVLTGGLVAIAALVGVATGSGAGDSFSAAGTWVVEGRVAVEVPAHWTVERVRAGPGSARVQVSSPEDVNVAIHVTQARVPAHETMQATAEALKTALDRQPHGIFTQFNAADSGADRPAVTYTELRSAVAVDWVVVIDRGLRIAVGCQHPLTGARGGPMCERAVRTAHAVP